jgi:hypothetical protein
LKKSQEGNDERNRFEQLWVVALVPSSAIHTKYLWQDQWAQDKSFIAVLKKSAECEPHGSAASNLLASHPPAMLPAADMLIEQN